MAIDALWRSRAERARISKRFCPHPRLAFEKQAEPYGLFEASGFGMSASSLKPLAMPRKPGRAAGRALDGLARLSPF